jgi:hypothetical protein
VLKLKAMTKALLKEKLKQHWKEILFFILCWSIGWYLFSLAIKKINPDTGCDICALPWLIFFTSLFLLLLPFVKKIEFGKYFTIEREIKETKNELRGFKADTQSQFTMLANSISVLSQNLSNNITIYNQAPDAETLKQENEIIDHIKPKSKVETTKLQDELKIVESDEDWIWVYNLLKIRVQMEKELRQMFSKMTSVAEKDELINMKYFSLTKLYELYLDKFPDSRNLFRSFRLFSSVANAAIHGQTINKEQYNQALGLGTRVLGDIKINQERGLI